MDLPWLGRRASRFKYRLWRPEPRLKFTSGHRPEARYYAFRNQSRQNTYIREMANSRPSARRSKLRLPLRVAFPLALGIILSVGILGFSEIGSRELQQVVESHSASLEMQTTLYEILGIVTDSETAQRGYLLTGKAEYLEPYRQARPKIEDRFRKLVALMIREGTPAQRDQVTRISNLVGKRMGEIDATLALYDRSGRDVAFELMNTGLGKQAMDQLRNEVEAMGADQRASMSVSDTRWKHDIDFARFAVQWLTACTVILLLVVWLLARREVRQQDERRKQLATESERLERDVRERTSELAELSTYLQGVREEEKSRLARDIHDELGGILVSAKMDVSNVAQSIAGHDPVSAKRLERALATLDDGVSMKRRIIEELRPTLLDNLGLVAAIDWQVHEVCDNAGLKCELNLAEDASDVPPGVGIALFRIVQEALTNILKYAGAKTVTIDLMRDDDGISLIIGDDGIGLPERASRDRLSHGITGMRQRVRALAGEFAIHGEPRRGTQIEVWIPLSRNPATEGDVSVPLSQPQPNDIDADVVGDEPATTRAVTSNAGP
jgi:signal transduction histidine kinase